MFTDDNVEKFPELLAHEMSHILDYNKRPGGPTDHMDEAEGAMDVIGQDMAAKAGYSSKPWGNFMKAHYEATKRKFKHTLDGGFRGKIIDLCEQANPPSPHKEAKNLQSYKDNSELLKNYEHNRKQFKSVYSRIASLRERIMPQEHKIPYKPASNVSKVDFNTLKMCQDKKQNG